MIDFFTESHEVQTSADKKPVCTDFGKIKSFRDLADVVFLLDCDYVNSGWNPEVPGQPGKGRFDEKIKWLTGVFKYHMDGWWIYDDQGGGHNLAKIARAMNPDWKEGESWTGDMTDDEKQNTIRESWLATQDYKVSKLAARVGGSVYKFSSPSMESGISSAVILPNRHMPEAMTVYRGIRHQHLDDVREQVCGMLRTGEDAEGKVANGPIHVDKWSQVVNDPEIRSAVYDLANDPSEEKLLALIELYKAHNYLTLARESNDSLKSVWRKMERGPISFAQALADLHIELMIGNVGFSPFVATSADMEMTADFTGNVGQVVMSKVDQERISRLQTRGSERLVKGWIDQSQVVAVVPVNRYSFEEIDRVELVAAFGQMGKELEALG